MNIKIKSITLRNFKGLRDVSFDFDGRNATIIGDNGTGKTTIFDALTWVLFGKDSHNSTDIDIKTIDATGEPMHRAEHFVRWHWTWTAPHRRYDAHIARYGANRADRPTCDSSDTKVRLPSMAWRSEPRRHTTKSFRNG